MPPKRVSFEQAEPSLAKRKSIPAAQYAFSFSTALTIFAAVNTIAALLAPIQDCDEVFNYWEPTHYLIHGYGRQTWEYSPEYAIRDWFYIGIHAAFAKISGFLVQHVPYASAVGLGGKVAEFYGLRVCLGTLCALSQARFVAAISRTLNPRVAIFTGMIMISSTGFFHAAPAFLPSSFAMSMGMIGASAFMDWKMGAGRRGAFTNGSNAGIMWFGAGAVLGWPFAGALIFPFLAEEAVVATIADDLLELVRKWTDGIVRAMVIVVGLNINKLVLLSAYAMQCLQLAINAFFYHKLVVVPWSIVLYNVFGGEGRGPEIFGTEPADFYIRNLFLNFNVWLLFGLVAAPMIVLQWLFAAHNQSKLTLMRSMFFVSPFYMWLAIFSAQAHKEERFMYPAYPFLALNAAVSLHTILTFVGTANPKTLMGKIPPQLKLLVVAIAVLIPINLGIFRTIGMVTAYRAPLTVYNELQEPGVIGLGDTVCLGKEWYRFPSSFFLPHQGHVKFIRSEFNGLLPGEFREANTGFGLYPGTWMIPSGMNDRNEFDPGKLTDIRGCSFLVDSHAPADNGSELEPNYVNSDAWETVQCNDFLDAASTHVIGRLIWIPDHELVPEQLKRKWNKFCLLKRKGVA